LNNQRLTEISANIFHYMTSDHQGNWGMDIHHWDWVPGVGIVSIAAYGQQMNEQAVMNYCEEWVGRNKGKAEQNKVINSMAPFAIFPDLYRRTGDSWYLEQAEQIATWMLEEAPRTREGAFEHTVTEDADFREQVWADTIFMSVLFLARYARLTKDAKFAEEALQQTLIHLRLLEDKSSGLLFHGWNCEAGNHMSACLWARANAWIVLATPEIVTELQELVPIPDELYDRYRALAAALREHQAEDGLWHTVLDRTDYMKETSASAGIACGFLYGIQAGMLDSSYLASATQALQVVLPLITEEGEVLGVSGGTPVMPTIEAYNTIPVYPTLYGQGLVLLLLAAWMSRNSVVPLQESPHEKGNLADV